MCCLSSTTVACNTTSSTCLWNTKMPLSVESGPGAESVVGGGEVDGESAGAGEPATGTGDAWFGAIGLVCEFARNSAVSRRRISRATLFRRRIVTRLGVDPERWQSFWRHEFHFYFTPFAIAHWVLWTVSDDILVAQF